MCSAPATLAGPDQAESSFKAVQGHTEVPLSGKAGSSRLDAWCGTTLQQAICLTRTALAFTVRTTASRTLQPFAGVAPRAAVEGDIVTLHYVCRDEDGNLIDASREHTEPVLFLAKLTRILGYKHALHVPESPPRASTPPLALLDDR